MRNIVATLVALQLIFVVTNNCQEVVTVIPDRPIIGDTISIVYNPNAPTAKLRNKQLVSLMLLPFARPSVRPAVTFARMYDMQFENGAWLKKLVLADSTTPFFKFSFYSGIGDSTETESGEDFHISLYDENGVPLPNAHLCKSFALGMLKRPDADSLRQIELTQELAVHPTNFRAHYVRWSNELKMGPDRPQASLAIRRTIDSVFQLHRDNLDALVGCANAYRELGDTARAEMLEFRLLTLYPISNDAQILRFRRAFSETNPDRKVSSLSELLQVFPDAELARGAFSVIERYYIGKGDSAAPKRIKEAWERIRSEDPNRINPSPEQVKRIVERRSMTQAPTFVLHDLNGNKISKDILGSRILVMDFWATWCKPCREALPHFQRLFDEYKAANRVTFVAVNVIHSGDSLANIQFFMRDHHYSFPVAIDSSNVTNLFSVAAIPTTIVIDSHGNIRYRTTGYLNPDEYSSAIKTAVELLLNE